ncbi:putative nucleotidyltransferase [Mongoliibacter ruber]|uniref:Putative nucleotidyltransferase n=2 Tax=Mongoliibacter ruber TaxID=1750599 RepID=A0A2T0WR45_9BACT|nr:putative nucleotidyltransferase [Mongoliibacter ruber]
MNKLGEKLRSIRKLKKLPLRTVAAALDIDQAIISKVERGIRKLSKNQVIKLSELYQVPLSELLVLWMADKVIYDLGDDDELAKEALKVAEEEVAYRVFEKLDRSKITKHLVDEIKKIPQIKKAWLYGSFARKDDGPDSDIDVAIETEESFSYFDLANVQYKLEQKVDRKVDIGWLESFKDYVWENVKPDLILIYEKG